MKKIFHFVPFFILTLCFSLPAAAQTNLSAVLPLLQAPTRTAAQNQQVLALFASSKDTNVVFAAGASLVRIPPSAAQEAKLLNIIIKDNDVLKKVFSAVILTAMGSMHEELSSLLQDAISSQDHAVRSYAAGAYTILNPQITDYSAEIINLYIYDPAFAQRAMNLIADELGIKWLFSKINQKPGQHMSFGFMGETPVFACPGNPVSAMFCNFYYVKPALQKMMGLKEYRNKPVSVILGADVIKKKGRVQFDRVKVVIENGKLKAYPFTTQDSHIIESLVSANAYAKFTNEMVGTVAQGTELDAYIFNAEQVFG